MEDASFTCCTEGSFVNVASGFTATSVAVNVMERGIAVDRRAKIDACKRAGSTGRFWISSQAEPVTCICEELTEALWGRPPMVESSSGLLTICNVN